MFSKDENKRLGGEVVGFIGRGVRIEGRLSFGETMRIEGSFKGEIDATGTLVVGDEGMVEGELKVGAAIITGTVSGLLEAAHRVELRSPAKVLGNIKTPNLVIGEGVHFEGQCIMVRRGTGAEVETVNYGAPEPPAKAGEDDTAGPGDTAGN